MSVKRDIFLRFTAPAQTARRSSGRGESRPDQGVGDEQAARARAAEPTPTRAEQQVQPAARASAKSHNQHRIETAGKL